MRYAETAIIKHTNKDIPHFGARMPRSGEVIAYKGEPIKVWVQDAEWLIDRVENTEWEYVKDAPPMASTQRKPAKRTRKSKQGVTNG